MSDPGKHLADLSPEEKRALLVELLEKKRRASGSSGAAPPDPAGLPDHFAVSVEALSDEAVLDPSIRVEAPPGVPPAEPARIFLTGATGFLGAFLLHELLRQTRAEIYCLVRTGEHDEGSRRILKTLESYLPEHRHESARIIPVPGDLSAPLLGLSTAQFEALAGTIDTIYHNGALVNWIFPYERLKATNVLGTQEVLRLASHRTVKPVHFVSSLSVFPVVANSDVKVVRERDSLDHGGVLYGGYTQSKWVAEKLVAIARSRGLPVSVYRPGLIVGHSRSGAWNTDDVTSRMLKSWIELGIAPDVEAAVDMTPVDYVSRAIVHLSRLPDAPGEVFHLANLRPVRARELSAWIRSFGYPLRSLPYEQWRAAMTKLEGQSRESAWYSLGPLLSMQVSEDAGWVGRIPEFDCRNTLARLTGTSIGCPPINAELFAKYFAYFVRTGFVEAPGPDHHDPQAEA